MPPQQGRPPIQTPEVNQAQSAANPEMQMFGFARRMRELTAADHKPPDDPEAQAQGSRLMDTFRRSRVATAVATVAAIGTAGAAALTGNAIRQSFVGSAQAAVTAEQKESSEDVYVNSGGTRRSSIFSERGQQPETIYTDHYGYIGKDSSAKGTSISVSGFVTDLEWSSWGDSTAQASGELHTQWTKSRGNRPSGFGDDGPDETTITLGGLVNCAGQSLYTKYSMELEPGSKQPRYFGRIKTGGAPCEVDIRSLREGGGGYSLNDRPDYGKMICGGELMTPPSFTSGCWGWKGENSQRAVGLGFIRTPGPIGAKGIVRGEDTRIYPTRVILRDPRWCHGRKGDTEGNSGSGMLYTRQRTIVYGNGIPDEYPGKRTQSIPKSVWKKLRGQIDEGGKRKIFNAHTPKSWRCDP